MSWFLNLKTPTKFLLIFSAFIALAALGAGWSIYSAMRLQLQVYAIQQQSQILEDTARAQIAFLEQHIAAKDYLLTGSPSAQSQYRWYDSQIQAFLRSALADAQTADEKEDLDSLRAMLAAYAQVNLDAQAALGPGSEPALAAQISAGQVDPVAAQIQAQFMSMLYKRNLELRQLGKDVDRQVRAALQVGIFSLAMLSLLVIVASIGVNQVAEPVEHLTNAVTAFGANVYTPDLLQDLKRRRDEMGQLARSVDEMTGAITTSLALKDRFINAAARFVPAQYLDFLEKDSIIDIRLGDHVSAEMAVMFSDVRGFTHLSENMSPQQNFDFVNEYLKLVSPIIQEHSGLIVKFLGDGMMAIFPYSVDDAVRAGIEKRRKVEEFNAQLVQRGLPPIRVGIGIHTGHMTVGMIGDELRLQGDAFSDNVNLTSRVEGLTKFYGVSQIITEETLLRLERPIPYRVRFLGKARVQGRDQPIVLYEIFDGDPDDLAALKQAILSEFELGIKDYLAGRLADAQAHFAAVLAKAPQDKSALLYQQRIQELLVQGLPEHWDGVEVVQAK